MAEPDEIRRTLRRRLAYYEAVLPRRPASYAALKARVIPRLRRALAKLDEGSYGFCDGCGARIAPKRLAAVPGATLCLACQGGTERGRP